ncbi:dienelactone hydrolase family protein [Trichothermofontia sp.]
MSDLSLHTEFVTVPNDDVAIQSYLAYPQDRGPVPAVIVLQEVFGVNAHIRQVTERIARAGYVAIAPALFQRTAPGFEVGYSEADLAAGRHHKNLTRASTLLSDIQATIAYLQAQPWVKPGGMGCVGFCFGGHVAYLAATLPAIRATASCYGAGIATMTPGDEGPPTITRTPDIHGTIYCFFGMDDPLIPAADVDAIAAALQAHQIDHRIFRFAGAGHGFCCDQRPDYRPDIAVQTWEAIFALFAEKLG